MLENMLYSYIAIECFCSLRHNRWNYRNMHLAGENEVITIKKTTHLLIILYKYSVKGKDLIPIVAQLISAGAKQCAVRWDSEAARTSR